MKKDHATRMGTTNITKLLISFSIPTIVGMLVNALYNVVDRIFLGQVVGNNAIGGVYLAFPFMIIAMAFAMLIGFGGNALSSIELGRGNREKSEAILNNSLVLLFFTGVALSILMKLFMKPLLLFFGGSEGLLPYAESYLSVLVYFMPVHLVQFGLNAFTRGEGNPVISMGTTLIGAIVNTVLDYVFIVKWDWGVAGAAWATGIGMTCSFLWVMQYFTIGSSNLKLYFPTKLEPSLILPSLRLGTSNFGMQLVSSFITIVYNVKLQAYGGDFAVATMGIVQSIAMLVFMPVIGLNQGAQPIMGYNYGARNYARVRKTLRTAAFLATGYMTIMWATIELWPESYISIFGSEGAGMDAMRFAVRAYYAMIPFTGSQIISASYFQATDQPALSLATSLSRQLIFLLPLIYLFSALWGLEGIWIATAVADFLSFVVTMALVKRDQQRIDRLEALNLERVIA